MANLLSSLTDNFAKGLHKITFKCADCKKKYEKSDEDLAKTFKDTFQYCDEDINKFCSMLGKGF